MRTARGSLFEQTTVVIGSEFGRAPRYDASSGKDHWPESSWVLAGRDVVALLHPDGVFLGEATDVD